MTAQPVIRKVQQLDDVALAGAAAGDPLVFDSSSGGAKTVATGTLASATDVVITSKVGGTSGDIILKAGSPAVEYGRLASSTGSLTLQKPTYWSVQGGGQTALAAQNSGGATAMGVLVFYGTGGTVNGLGPQGQSFGIGVDATDRSSLFIGRVNADNSTTDFIFAKWNNGNGAPYMGIGVTQGFPPTATLSVSGSDGDRTQGGIAIRKNVSYVTDGDGVPLRVYSSSDGTIRQAFNVHGGLWLGGNPDGVGLNSDQGVQFIASGGGAGGTNPPTIDSSIYLSGAGVITTDALLQTLHSETAHRGLQVGVPANFPLNIQQDFGSSNKSAQIFHNAYNVGTSTFWSATSGSFGSRGIVFDGSASTAGIIFYADTAATTGGSSLTPTERLRIRNDGMIFLADGSNLAFHTTTGTQIGTSATQKLAFYGATAIVQPSAVGSATGYAAGSTAATFHSDDTYTGNVGSTAYTINGIVAALKNLGLIKS